MPRKGENIYRRKDGRWEGRYISSYDIYGKACYRSVYGNTYMEAKEKKRQAIAGQRDAKKPDANSPEFAEICGLWLENTRQAVKESSYVKYRNVLEAYVLPELGGQRMSGMDAHTFERFFEMLLTCGRSDGRGLSAKTVNDVKSIVKNILRYARDQGYTRECSIDHIVIKQPARTIRVLTQSEQTVLEHYLISDITNVHIGIYLCLYTGIRLGELCALCWPDVDLESGTIFVGKTMQRIRDYSKTSGRRTKIIETVPKSACSIREIPLPGFLLELLHTRKPGGCREGYVLTDSTRKYMEPRSVEYTFQKIISACEIDKANFHCLRHTFATRCVEAGFDIKTLSEILGHANVNITLNRYVHPSLELKRSNMNKLNHLS